MILNCSVRQALRPLEESKTNGGGSWFSSSASSVYLGDSNVSEALTEMRNRLNECGSATYNCFAETVKNPHVWAHAVGIGMMVAGSAMMGKADVTWESHESTCTDDTKRYDDDYYDGHRHRHYHSHTHDCTETECIGPDCGQYYGGMALLIGGAVIVALDWYIICGCDCSNDNNGGGRRNGHNVRFDSHHNRGRGW